MAISLQGSLRIDFILLLFALTKHKKGNPQASLFDQFQNADWLQD